MFDISDHVNNKVPKKINRNAFLVGLIMKPY